MSSSAENRSVTSLTRFRLEKLEEGTEQIWHEIKQIREERTKDLRESVKLMRGVFISVFITLVATLVNIFVHLPAK